LSRKLFILFTRVINGYTVLKKLIIREGKDSSKGTDSGVFITNEATGSFLVQVAFVVIREGYEEDD
jgi:hypothetical protein